MASTSSLTRPASPRLADAREPRKHPLPPTWNKSNFGYVWMSVPKNYRCVLFRFFLIFYGAESIVNQRVERRWYSHWFTSWTSHRIFSPFFLAETDIKWWDCSPRRLANRNACGTRKFAYKILGFAIDSSFALQLGRPQHVLLHDIAVPCLCILVDWEKMSQRWE